MWKNKQHPKNKYKTRLNQLGGGDNNETLEPNRQQLKQMSTMIRVCRT